MQGCSDGRGTRGSAVTVNCVPTCRFRLCAREMFPSAKTICISISSVRDSHPLDTLLLTGAADEQILYAGLFHVLRSRVCVLDPVQSVVTVLTPPADGQSVISTRSGIVHFFEGAVYLGDQPLESHPGKFSSVPQGAELRTAEGRAEVLLTPDVFVRIGERSTIRMVANDLSDTRVELLAGSAVVDSAEPSSGTSVTLIYRNWNVRFFERGVYRIDSDPPRLWVLQGEAEVSANGNPGRAIGWARHVSAIRARARAGAIDRRAPRCA